jgi:hypothetical protein
MSNSTPRDPLLLFPAPVNSYPSTAVSLPLVPLLQRQLETTLRLLISVSQEMMPDKIIAVRIHLTEAALVMGDMIANPSNSVANGNSTPPLHLLRA